MIKEATEIISSGKNLASTQMAGVMEEIMSGRVNTPEIVDFLTALNKKGETIDELTAAVKVMRSHSTKIDTPFKTILDTCGTGADVKGTFNISTAAAFIAAACGINVAKHGNRSVSSCCGSADVLEALGINVNLSQEAMKRCLEEISIAFLFAPNLHPAMKYAIEARRQIGKKTIFNLLGPLSNPAGAAYQLVGVYDTRLTETFAVVLRDLRAAHALVVCGEDGLDEITITSATNVSEVLSADIKNYRIYPEDFGIKRSELSALKGASVSDNAKILLDILRGEDGPKRDIAVLNAAAAIYVADKVHSIKEGIPLAKEAIDSGKALAKLEQLRELSNKV